MDEDDCIECGRGGVGEGVDVLDGISLHPLDTRAKHTGGNVCLCLAKGEWSTYVDARCLANLEYAVCSKTNHNLVTLDRQR